MAAACNKLCHEVAPLTFVLGFRRWRINKQFVGAISPLKIIMAAVVSAGSGGGGAGARRAAPA
jgi:hypothetical protein